MSNPAFPQAPAHTAPLRATSRSVWWTTCLLCVGLVLFRLPATIRTMEATMADQLVAQDLDPSLLSLSVNIAAYLGVILFAIVMILYLSLAALLEKKILPYGLTVRGGQGIGLFCLLIAVLTVSAQVFAFATGALPAGPMEVLWVVGVASLLPLLYRRHWSVPGRMTTRHKALLFVVSICIGALVSLL